MEGGARGGGCGTPSPTRIGLLLLWAALACFGLLWAAFKDLIENLTFQRICLKSCTFNEDLIKNRIFQRICMKSFTFKDLIKNRTFCMKSFTFNKDLLKNRIFQRI